MKSEVDDGDVFHNVARADSVIEEKEEEEEDGEDRDSCKIISAVWGDNGLPFSIVVGFC